MRSVDELSSRLIEELRKGERMFNGFSDDSLYLQDFLRRENWARSSWDDDSREIYAEDIKPELSALLSDCANALSSVIGQTYIFSLGSPFPHGNVAKWFWGAVVPEGRTIHNDIQLFVALRWGYVRVGLYLNDQNQKRFDRAMESLARKETEALAALAMAEENGVTLCQKIPDISRGMILPYDKSEKDWSKEFIKRREIDLLKAWEVEDDDLRVSEFAEDVLRVISSVMPLYRILS